MVWPIWRILMEIMWKEKWKTATQGFEYVFQKQFLKCVELYKTEQYTITNKQEDKHMLILSGLSIA